MELTEKQQQWLEQLVFDGQVKTTVEIINGNATIELVSLTGETQLASEAAMSKVEGTPLFVIHTYAVHSLAQSLKSFTAKGKTVIKFKDASDALAFIKARPAVLIDAMIKAQSDFENELKKIVTPENVEENFSQTPGTAEGSNSMPKE